MLGADCMVQVNQIQRKTCKGASRTTLKRTKREIKNHIKKRKKNGNFINCINYRILLSLFLHSWQLKKYFKKEKNVKHLHTTRD